MITRCQRPIVRVDKDTGEELGVHINALEAAKWLKTNGYKGSHSNIIRVCNNVPRYHTAGGFKWKHQEATSLEGEIWRRINPEHVGGFDEAFVSNKGRIKDAIGIRKQYKGEYYYRIQFKLIEYLVHRLVALMFIINIDPTTKIEVNHIDKNGFNNDVSNLEWVTHQENIDHSRTAYGFKWEYA